MNILVHGVTEQRREPLHCHYDCYIFCHSTKMSPSAARHFVGATLSLLTSQCEV